MQLREDMTARFSDGKVGFWRVESPARKPSTLTIDVPVDKNTYFSYEAIVDRGRYQPFAVQFLGRGQIFFVSGKSEKERKKVGSFSMDLKTMKPLLDPSLR